MIIIIEGIDGAGKTTVIQELAKIFNAMKLSQKILFLDKKSSNTNRDLGEKEKLSMLYDLIWNKHEFSKDPFGAYYWIKLIAAWYTTLESKTKPLYDEDIIRIYDGWFYRNIVKTHLRENIDIDWINSLFSDVYTPEITYLLDVKPETAWRRNPNKKTTEIGYWDGETAGPETSYVNYQEKIRKQLLYMAKQSDWKVLVPNTNESPKKIAENIAYDLINNYLHF